MNTYYNNGRTTLVLLLTISALLLIASFLFLFQPLEAAVPSPASSSPSAQAKGASLSSPSPSLKPSLSSTGTITGTVEDFAFTGEGCPECLGANLSLTKSDNQNISHKGSVLVYTLNYQNNGADLAAGVTITEIVPFNTTFVANLSSAGWQQFGTTNIYNYNLGTVAKGASGSLTFAVRVDDPLPAGTDTITNTAVIGDDGSHGPDKEPANNSATDVNFISENPTDACGTITSDTTWTPQESPYIITCDITIPANVTLLIEPGTEVRFNSNTGIRVFGTLAAQGTANHRLYFLANSNTPSPGFWDGIDIFAGGQALVDYANLSHGGSTTDSFDTTLYVQDQGALTLRHSTVSDSATFAAYLSLHPNAPTPSALAHNLFLNNNAEPVYLDLNGGTLSQLLNNDGAGNNSQSIGIEGSINGVNTWGQTNGLPLRMTNHVTLNAGASLTLREDTVFKATHGSQEIYVHGTLTAEGVPGAPVVFTSIHDDRYGGDTNNNGPSSGAPGHWGQLYFFSDSSGSSLNHCVVAYGGNRSFGNIVGNMRVHTPNLTLDNCTIEQSHENGIYAVNAPLHISNSTFRNNAYTGLNFNSLQNNLSLALTENTFNNNGDYAVFLDLNSVHGNITLSDNAAAGNGINGAGVQGSIAGGTLNMDWREQDDFSLRLSNHLTVNNGATLNLSANTVIKGSAGWQEIYVHGTLLAAGTAAQPIVFTSEQDDRYGGDTNGDGSASSGSPGQWGQIYFFSDSSNSVLDQCIVAYGGNRSFGNIEGNIRIHTADVAVNNCTIERSHERGIYTVNSSLHFTNNTVRHNAYNGLSFDNLSGTVDILLENNTFHNNDWAVFFDFLGVNGQAVVQNNAAFSNNTNGVGLQGTVSGALTMDWQNQEDFSLRLNDHLTVNNGATLNLSPNTVIKGSAGWQEIYIHGTLNAVGTAAQPIIFTSDQNDEYGGDTTNNGASTGSPGQWGQIYFFGDSNNNVLDNCVVSYGGNRSFGNIEGNIRIHTADVAINNCTIERSHERGIYTVNSSLHFSSNLVRHNAYNGLSFDNLSGAVDILLENNTFHNNDWAVFFDFLGVSGQTVLSGNIAHSNNVNGVGLQGSVSGALMMDWQAQDDFSLRLNDHLNVNNGATLSLSPNTVIKAAEGWQEIGVHGTLLAAGTAEQPIIFTSHADDQYGGDTNNNGPSSGAPGNWGQIYFYGDSSAGVLDNCVVRYGGNRSFGNIAANIRVHTPDVAINNCTVEQSHERGIYALNSPLHFSNNIVRNNAYSGLEFDNLGAAADILLANNTFNNNEWAVFLDLTSASGNIRFENNIATGNLINGAGIQGGTGGDLNFDWVAQSNFALRLNDYLTVNAGHTLSLSPGVILKAAAGWHEVHVHGTLLAAGSPGQPVVFTSHVDDRYGGDTNNDGASNGGPGNWGQIYFHGGSSGVLNHCVVSYGGNRSFGNIEGNIRVHTSDLDIDNCIVESSHEQGLITHNAPLHVTNSIFRNNAYSGIHFDNLTAGIDIELVGNNFQSNDSHAIFLDMDNSSGSVRLADNIISGNVVNAAGIQGAANGDLDLDWSDQDGFALRMNNDFTVNAGITMTLSPGVVFKASHGSHQFHVFGNLLAEGTAASPIVFTTEEDDRYGGDTNNNGPSNGARGAWGQLNFHAGSSGILNHCVVSYGGNRSFGGINGTIQVDSPNVSLTNCTVQTSHEHGIFYNTSSPPPAPWSGNQIFDNSFHGLVNNGTATIDARNSWWGHVSGPFHPTLNPGGLGNQVGNNVLFDPWLTLAAGFSATLQAGSAPLSTTFNDESTGDITGWLWEFGDGITSTLPSPSHTYSISGSYTVTLTVSGPGGSLSLSRANYITVNPPSLAQQSGAVYLAHAGAPVESWQLQRQEENLAKGNLQGTGQSDPPPLPSSYYGSATVEGDNVPEGTAVTAWINGVLVEETAVLLEDGLSVYRIDVPGDISGTVPVEGGLPGSTITFRIGGAATNQTTPWQSGTYTSLNLTTTFGADLSVIVSPLPAELLPGQSFSYTFEVQNSGGLTATGILVQTALAPDLEFLSADNGGTADGQNVSWPLISLVPGEVVTYSVSVQVADTLPAGIDNIDTTVKANHDGNTGLDPTPEDNSLLVSVPVLAEPDLQIVQSADPSPVAPGSPLQYTLTITNAGNQGASGILVSQNLPDGLIFLNASDSGVENEGTVTWFPFTLPAGESASRMVNVQVQPLPILSPTVTTLTTTATVTDDGANGADAFPGDNSHTLPLPLVQQPDLTVPQVDPNPTAVDAQALTINGEMTVQLQNAGNFDLNTPFEVTLFEDSDADGLFSPLGDNILSQTTLNNTLSIGQVISVGLPVSGTILFRDNPIHAYADSAEIITELNEFNNYNNTANSCLYFPQPEAFDPVVELSWPGPGIVEPGSIDTISTPLVVNLTDDNGDGAINDSDSPDIVFITADLTNFIAPTMLRAIHGDTGAAIFNVPQFYYYPSYDYFLFAIPGLAAGDIDNDGKPEIIISSLVFNLHPLLQGPPRNRLVAYEHNGVRKWFTQDYSTHPTSGPTNRDNPTLADLDGDGTPEIIVGATVFNNNGSRRWTGSGGEAYQAARNNNGVDSGAISVVANLDMTGNPELVTGNTAYHYDGSIYWQIPYDDGYPAIANFDEDEYPEIVVVARGKIRLHEHDGTLIWGPITLPGTQPNAGGAPTVADFDGDGQPEIGVAGSDRYVVFETDGTLKWQTNTQDNSSNMTGSTVFDLDGDGNFEVLYRDERRFRIYRGVDGVVLYEHILSSETMNEEVVVADSDGDGNAEILVTSDRARRVANIPGNQRTFGLRVFGDANDNWVTTRPIWNQHAYAIDNVNNDGTIPAVPEYGWLTHNTFRANLGPTPGDPTFYASPDLTASRLTLNLDNFPEAVVGARIGNGGAALAPAGTPVSFYNGDPNAGGTLIGVVPLPADLEPGEYIDLTIDWTMTGFSNGVLFVRADDDGTGRGRNGECRETNNVHSHAYDTAVLGLVLNKDDGRTVVSGGDIITYTLTTLNAFPATANGVTLTDTLPAYTTFITATDGGTVSPDGTTVTWPAFSIAAGDVATRTVTVQVTDTLPVTATEIINQAVVTDDGGNGPDQTPGNNSALDQDNLATVQADAGGPYTGDEGVAIGLDASGSFDRNGLIVSYEWDLDGDGEYDDAVGVTTTVTLPDNGQITIGLLVTDNDGETDTDTTQVSAENAAANVTVEAALEFDEGQAQTVDVATFTDTGSGDSHTATIDWGDGTIISGTVADGSVSGSHTYIEDGIYTLTVCVTDDDGSQSCDDAPVTVNNLAAVVEAGPDTAAGSGETVTLAPATFVDSGSTDTHTATINWGDGTIVSGTISENGGVGTVDGSHVYAVEAVYLVEVCVHDDDGATGCDTFFVNLVDLAVRVDDGRPSARPGDTLTYTLTITNAGTLGVSGVAVTNTLPNYSTFIFANGSGNYNAVENEVTWFITSMIPGEVATRTLQVQIDASPPPTATQLVNTAEVTDNGLNGPDMRPENNSSTDTDTLLSVTAHAGGPYSGTEGQPILLDASATTDRNGTIELYEWDLDGDGAFDDAVGVTTTLTLADNGQVTVAMRATDDSGEQDVAPAVVDAANAEPVVDAADSLTVIEGDSISQIVATFTDLGSADTHTATVDWGDGTAEEALVTGSNGSGSVFAGHSYPDDGAFNVQICVSDDDGGQGCATLPITVDNGVPFIVETALTDLRLWDYDELLSCYDASPYWQVSADGEAVTQTINSRPSVFYGDFSASDTHIEGTVSVHTQTITATAPFYDDDYIGFVLGYQPDDLNNEEADYLLLDWKSGNPQGFTFGCGGYTEAQPGLALSRVHGSPADSEMWGHVDHSCNGSENGVVELARATTLGDSGWLFNNDYVFAFELTASNLKVYVNGVLEIDIDGDFAALSAGNFGFYTYSQADVTFRDFQFDSITVDEGSVLTLESSFTDPGLLDTHTATIDWGDGSVVTGTLTEVNGAGTVNGSHIYGDGDASHTMQLCIEDDDGGQKCQVTDVNVRNVAPAVEAGPDISAFAGQVISLTAATFTDPGLLDTHVANIDWGDGTAVSQTVTAENGSGPILANHSYAADGVYTVEVCVTDDDGGQGCDTFQVNHVDLSVTKSDGRPVAVPGQLLTYTLTIENHSTLTVTGVLVADILPEFTTFQSAGDGGTVTDGGRVITWEIPTLAAEATITRSVTILFDNMIPADLEVITNTGFVTYDGVYGAEETLDNNQAVDVNLVPDAPQANFLPANGLNATRLSDGAAVVAASSVWSSSTADRADNAIDDNPASRWRTASGAITDQSMTISLMGSRLHVIDTVTLQGSSDTAAPQNFAVLVSTTGLEEDDFTTVFTETLPQDGSPHTFTFPPVQARYVKLLINDNWGHIGYIELYHFAAYGRPRQGGAAALLEAGASIAAASGQNSSQSPDNAIDFSTTTYWEAPAGQVTSQWIKVDLIGDNSQLIDRVRIQGSGATSDPQEFQIMVSNNTVADTDFVPVHFGTLPLDGQAHWVVFPPIEAKYVQLFIENTHGSTTSLRVYDFQVYDVESGGAVVPFDDFSRGSDSAVAAWNWDFGDGESSAEQHPTHTYVAPGTYTVTLTITDSFGVTDNFSRTYTVLPPPTAVFTWTPVVPNENQAVNFTDLSTAPGGLILMREWEFTQPTSQPNGSTTTTTFPDSGVYPVRLTVTNNRLVTATVVYSVTVRNITPTVNLSPDSILYRTGDPVVIPGSDISLSVTDPSPIDLANMAYYWDVGDGRVFTSTTVNFSYPAAGTYTITLTVTDLQGASATDSMQVTVYEDHAAPEVTIDLVGSKNVALLQDENIPSLGAAGAEIVGYTSRFDSTHVPEQIINLNTGFPPWATGNGQTTNQSAVILLAGGDIHEIDRIRIQPRADGSATQRVKDFEVWVSTTTADPWAFSRVLEATAADNGNLQEFLLPGGPVDARYVKYVALDNRGSTCCISTTAFQVVATGTAPPGGIVSVSSENGANTAERILDQTSYTFWQSTNGQNSNQQITVLLADGLTYPIHGVSIQPRSGSESLRDFLIQVSTTTSDDTAFTTVYTGTASNNGQLQNFIFPEDVNARYVRLVALNNHGSNCCISIYRFMVRASTARESDNWFNSEVLVRVTATDDAPGSAGVALVQYSTNSGGSWTTFNAPFLFTTHGSTPFAARAIDHVDNQSAPLFSPILIDQSYKVSSQEAGQQGANWLTEAVYDESLSLNCVACHVQGDSLHGLALGTATGYVIDTDMDDGIGWLAEFITRPTFQNPSNGLWGHPPGGSGWRTINSSHSLFGLAMYDRYVATDRTDNFLFGVNAMLARQQGDGRWDIDHTRAPTNQGDIEPTVHMLFALNQAKQHVDAATAAQYQLAIDKALTWLTNASVSTNQDRALKLIGLIEGGVPRSDPLVTDLISTVLNSQFEDGGWAETNSFIWTSSFATGQSVYALCVAGVSRSDPQVVQGIDWLIHHQVGHTPNSLVSFGSSNGPWPLRYTGAVQPFVSTMWPVIALGCYGDLSFELDAAPDLRLLTPDLPISQTVTYTVTLLNTGIATDTYNLSTSGSSPGWNADLSETIVTVGVGGTAQLTLTVEAPPDLPQGLAVPFSIIASSQTAPAVVRIAQVQAATSLPPVDGHPTETTIIAGDGVDVPINTPIHLAATVTDTVTGEGVSGPGSGVVNFLVAGIAVGTDGDTDGDGIYEITWTPDADWTSIETQNLRAIYSGIDRPEPDFDLLPSFTAGSLTINAAVDLVVSKDDGVTTAEPDDILTYTITIANEGNLQALSVTITDTIPAHTTVVTATNGGSVNGGQVTWPAFDLVAGQSANRTLIIQVNATIPAETTAITNTVTAVDDGSQGVDPTPENNTAVDVNSLLLPTNNAPVAEDDTAETPEDMAVIIDVLANDTDIDGDDLTVLTITVPFSGTAVINPDSTVTYTPVADFFGSDSFSYSISDGNGGTDTAVVTITVTSVNDPPVALADAATTPEDTAVTIDVLANDSDIDSSTLTVVTVTVPLNGTAVINPDNTITYTPAADFNGSDSFTYTISDGDGGEATASVSVVVEPANDDPMAMDDTAETDEDVAVTFTVLTNDTDVDGDSLMVTAVTTPTYGTAVVNPNDTVTYTPAPNYHGPDSFVYTVSDGSGGTDTAVVTITVNPVNDAPVAVDDTAATNEDTAVTVDVLANDSDVDADTLTVTAVTDPAGGTAAINPPSSGSGQTTITFTPTANFNGSASFVYTISDGSGGEDTATVVVTVNAVNDDPMAVEDSVSIVEDMAVAIVVLANDSDVDGDTLTVTQVTVPANGTAVVNVDNTVTYTPTENFNGSDTFVYTISDGSGGEDTATVTITVNPVNDAPVAVDDTAATDEDTAVTIAVLTNDSDVDGDALQVTGVTSPTNGAAVVNPDYTVTYTPTADFHGSDSFSYTISDGNGGEDTATVTITVNPVNDAPVANDDAVTTPEDTPTAITVLANDVDLDGDVLAVISVTQPITGLVVINPDSTITYTPTAEFSGVITFTYTIDDSNGGTDTAVVVVTVTYINDPPNAVNDAATTPEDTPISVNVLTNDSDIEGEPLTVIAVTQPAHGTVVINPDFTVTYTPNLDYNSTDSPSGLDTFTYTARDPGGATAVAQVDITVTPVNDPPVAVDDSVTASEDNPVTIDVLDNDYDVDGDTITITDVTVPQKGVAVINLPPSPGSGHATIIYTPTTDYNGTDSFAYTITDSQGATDTAIVTVIVAPLADPPVAVDDTATTDEDTAVAVAVVANDSDVDGDPLTVTAVTTPTNGTAAINLDNTVTYTPTANFNGTDSFAYTISDGSGGEDTATVTVTVNAVNDPPNAADDAIITDEDTAVTINVLANDIDIDGDALTVFGASKPDNGEVVTNLDNTFTYTPAPNFDGVDTFTYNISDGNGGTDSAVVTVTVTSKNDNPTAVDDTATVDEDGAVTVNVLANDSDADADPLMVTNVTTPTNGVAVINPDYTITYTPTANFNGSDSFVYTLNDEWGGSDTALVTITVNAVNDLPVAIDDSAITNEDLPITLDVLANDSDIDGDTLIVSSVTTPTNGLVVINPDNSVTYTPAADYHGPDSFVYTISDGNGGTDTATVTLMVNSVNDAPTAVDDAAATTEDTAVTIAILANDFDVDADPITITVVTTPTDGVLTLNGDNTITYTPNADFNGADGFSYTIIDGQGGSDTADVTIAINPVNDAPVAVNDAVNTNEDTPVNINVLSNDSDIDGDSLTVESVTPPANGTAVIQPDSTVTYTPTANFNGVDTFSYTINDGNGGMDTATVTVTVQPVNDAPVAVDDAVVTAEDTAVTIAVLDNDSDPDGDNLTVTTVTTPTHGMAVINPPSSGSGQATVTYTPTADYIGTDTFVYTISDGSGGTDTAVVTITITSENDNPVAVNDAATTDEDTAVTIAVLNNDSDVDNDDLTVTSVTTPTNGVAVINPDNTVTYTPTANFNGSDSFTYSVSDGNGGSDTAVVTITVEPVNDNPMAADDSATTNEDTAVTVNILANDSDLEGSPLSIISVSQPNDGAVVLNGNNTITYQPDSGFVGVDSFTYTISDGSGGSDTATVTITVLPVAAECNLYPIALSQQTLAGAEPGDILGDIWNGGQPGNFGWLTWNGSNNVPSLIASLTPPGNSHLYKNPYDPNDHVVSIGDWVQGKPGVSNAIGVRNALDNLIGMEIVVPVWDMTQGNGANANYHVSGFAIVRLLDYHLPGQDRITAQFMGYATCLDS